MLVWAELTHFLVAAASLLQLNCKNSLFAAIPAPHGWMGAYRYLPWRGGDQISMAAKIAIIAVGAIGLLVFSNVMFLHKPVSESQVAGASLVSVLIYCG